MLVHRRFQSSKKTELVYTIVSLLINQNVLSKIGNLMQEIKPLKFDPIMRVYGYYRILGHIYKQ